MSEKVPNPLDGIRTCTSLGYEPIVLPITPPEQARLASVRTRVCVCVRACMRVYVCVCCVCACVCVCVCFFWGGGCGITMQLGAQTTIKTSSIGLLVCLHNSLERQTLKIMAGEKSGH